MKYKKLIQFHSYYILGKLSSIVLGVVCILFIVLFVISSGMLEVRAIQDLNRYAYHIEYKATMILALKMIGTLISCYLFGYNFISNQDTYYVFCMGKNITKIDYVATKLITISFLFIIFVTIIGCLYCMIGLFGTPWFYVTLNDIMVFFLFAIQGVIIGLITAMLTLYLNNLYVGLISYGVFVLNEILTDSISSINELSFFIKFARFLFPTMVTVESNHFLLYGVIHAFCCLLLYVLIFIIIYQKKDFPS